MYVDLKIRRLEDLEIRRFGDEVDDIWDEDSETSAIIKVWFGKETVIALSVIIASDFPKESTFCKSLDWVKVIGYCASVVFCISVM